MKDNEVGVAGKATASNAVSESAPSTMVCNSSKLGKYQSS